MTKGFYKVPDGYTLYSLNLTAKGPRPGTVTNIGTVTVVGANFSGKIENLSEGVYDTVIQFKLKTIAKGEIVDGLKFSHVLTVGTPK